ncbi:TIR domain-containing protein [Leptothoe spongobia]|uniref:TIR domain-containing protein n=1 Tax=Leptothoe spongobia TAU-MAC 1115 TaxID=1967444 RepID=A0A947GJV4_9CYAN|nr:TIR domain-containing protein [Leptothoe spongobia]MBT9316839.1 TIR domain-containing protein [Leptothoe spongobia TAU-MAC 1115]
MPKILILAANPNDTTRLRIGEEVRDISNGLERASRRDEFEIEQRWAVRPRDLQRAMLDEMPQIVHFSGHGAGDAGLYFEDVSGNAQLVTGSALAGLFKLFGQKGQIDCVLLNGCYSQAQAEAIVEHVPYVIGMSDSMGDRAAIEFAVGFYDALGAGESVEFAFELGKSAVALSGSGDEDVPILLKGDSVGSLHATTLQTSDSSATVLTTASDQSKPAAKASVKKDTLEVFFSYAHEDEDLRDRLATHLKLLERQKVISAWYDRDITGGEEWETEILEQLEKADIILLLISADFLASDFCWGVELEQAMKRHGEKSACVIPIILRSVDWKDTPFSKLQALPKNAEPVTNWTNQDQAFTDIAKGIRRVAERLKK